MDTIDKNVITAENIANIVKKYGDIMIFTDYKHFVVDDEEAIQGDIIFATDKDGETYEIKISEIEKIF